MIKLVSVVGARPNFMKIAPFSHAIRKHNEKVTARVLETPPSALPTRGMSLTADASQEPPDRRTLLSRDGLIQHVVVHTGQHYDDNMSERFFSSLGIPEPDFNLEIGSGSDAEQVGQTMIALERILIETKPDWVVVVGDVNATLAASVTAKKLWIKVAHIEAGLRSGDLSMPEEINRLVTDRLSDLLLVPDRRSSENLRHEGVSDEKIVFVGNIMVDTLEANRRKAESLAINEIIEGNSVQRSKCHHDLSRYVVMTLHRPSNVDHKVVFQPILDFLIDEVAATVPLIWPIHPRAKKTIESFGLWDRLNSHPSLIVLNPIDYLEMLRLNMSASVMFTDSGGLQEECTVLGTPCVVLRWNTERPITLAEHNGVSILVGNEVNSIRKGYTKALSMGRTPQRPELWDGNAAHRCLQAIVNAA